MAAKEEAPPPAGDVAAQPKKGKLKLIIIILVVLLVVLTSAFVAFLVLTKPTPEAAPTAQAEAPKPVESKAPTYLPIDSFTVNLVSEIGDQYLQIALTLDMNSTEAAEKARQFMPKIRNDLTVHLASQKPPELATKEGKEKLAGEIRTMINKTLDPALKDKPADGAVHEVLFTSFIIQ